MASPTGLVVKSIIPIAETAIMLKATQTPDPSKNNNKEIKKIVKNISFISIYFLLNIEFIKWWNTHIKNIIDPKATADCGIQINISSAPSLRSPNLIEI